MRAAVARAAVSVAIAVALVLPAAARAQPPATQQVDRVVVRFTATETGGTAQPRFVDERTLAFEARLEVLAEKTEGDGGDYAERHLRAALERHVAETMLATLGDRLLRELPPAQRPAPD